MTELHVGIGAGRVLSEEASYESNDATLMSEFASYDHALTDADAAAIGEDIGGALESRDTGGATVDSESLLDELATQMAHDESLMSVPMDTGFAETPLPPELIGASGSDALESAGELGHDPVNPGTGEFRETWTDLALPGVGPAFSLQRVYRSRFNYDGPLGHGWDHSYNQRLMFSESACGGAEVHWMTGRAAVVRFEWTGSRYRSPLGEGWWLRRVADGWQISAPDGSVTGFGNDGLLKVIRDAQGRQIVFGWSAGEEPQLQAAFDTNDRVVVFHYDDAGYLARVEVPALDLEVRYEVDASGDLIRVESAAGVEETYTYTSGQAFPADYVPTAAVVPVCERRCGVAGALCDVRPACAAVAEEARASCEAGCNDPQFCQTACAGACGPACDTECQSQCGGACDEACDDWSVEACHDEVANRVADACNNSCKQQCKSACNESCEFFFVASFGPDGVGLDGLSKDELLATLHSGLWFTLSAVAAVGEGLWCAVKKLGSVIICGLTFGLACPETSCSFKTTKKAWMHFCNQPCTACCRFGAQCDDGVCMNGRDCEEDCVDSFLYGEPTGLRDSCEPTLQAMQSDGCIVNAADACGQDCRALNCDCGETACRDTCTGTCAEACADPAPCQDFCGEVDFFAECEQGCMDTCVAELSPPGDFPVYGRSPDLLHNLLTITDGEGRTWLTNSYGLDPLSPSFDRVIEQQHGDDTITFSYTDLAHEDAPDAAPEDAALIGSPASLDVCPPEEICTIVGDPELWIPVDDREFIVFELHPDQLRWVLDPIDPIDPVDPIDPIDPIDTGYPLDGVDPRTVVEVHDLFGTPSLHPPTATLPDEGLPLETGWGTFFLRSDGTGAAILDAPSAKASYALSKALEGGVLTIISDPFHGVRVFEGLARGAVALHGEGGCRGEVTLVPGKDGPVFDGDCKGTFTVDETARRFGSESHWRGLASDPLARVAVEALRKGTTKTGLIKRLGVTPHPGANADPRLVLEARYGPPPLEEGEQLLVSQASFSQDLSEALAQIGDPSLEESLALSFEVPAQPTAAIAKSADGGGTTSPIESFVDGSSLSVMSSVDSVSSADFSAGPTLSGQQVVLSERGLGGSLSLIDGFRFDLNDASWASWIDGPEGGSWIDGEVSCVTDRTRFGRAKQAAGITDAQPFTLATVARAGDAEIVYLADRQGRVLRRTHHGTGEQQDMGYDEEGRLRGLVSDFGDQVCLRYDAADNVVSQTSLPALGHYAGFAEQERRVEWAAHGRPLSFYAPGSDEVLQSFEWSEEGALLSHTVAELGTWTYEYDGRGRVRDIIAPGGVRTHFSFDAETGLWATRISDADGPVPYVTTVERDELGRVIALERTGSAPQTMTFDADGRPLSASFQLEGHEPVVRTWAYDMAGRLTGITRSAVVDGEAESVEVALEQNLRGQLVRQSTSDGETTMVTCARYDAQGRLAERVLPEGNRVRYVRDPAGRVVGVQAGATAGSETWDAPCLVNPRLMPLGMETVTTRELAGGGVAKRVSNADRQVEYRRDGYGRVIEAHVIGAAKYRVGYDLAGRVAWRATYREEAPGVFGPGGEGVEPDPSDPHLVALTTYEYDPAGRMRREARAWFVDTPSGREFVGDGWAETRIDYADSGRVIEMTDPEGRMTRVVRDNLGRTASVERPGGLTVTLTYSADGRTITENWPAPTPTAQLDRVTLLSELGQPLWVSAGGIETFAAAYDALGRPSWQRARGQRRELTWDGHDRLRGVGLASPDGASVIDVQTLDWDRNGRRVRLQGARAAEITQWRYDHLDRLVEVAYPVGGVETRAYQGGSSRPWLLTDRNGSTLEVTWDGAGRVTAVDALAGSSIAAWLDTTRVEYGYGPLGLEWGQTNGDPASPDDDVLITQRYSSLGDLVEETSSLFPEPVTRSFDGAGFERELGVAGRHIGLEPDVAGRIAHVTLDGATIAKYTFKGLGGYAHVDYGNGVAEERLYDAAARPTGYDRGTFGRTWVADAAGHVLRADSWGEVDATSVFGRDAFGRLVVETHGLDTALLPSMTAGEASAEQIAPWHQSSEEWRKLALDDSGNRLGVEASDEPFFAPARRADNRYARYLTKTPSDAAGQMAKLEGKKMRYNALGQLAKTYSASYTYQLSYDPLGRLVRWKGTGGETRLQYAGGSIVRVSDATGDTVAVPGPLGAPVAFTRGESVGWVHYGIGTRVQAITDSVGKIRSWYEWSAWGEPMPVDTDAGEDPALSGYSLLLTGQPWFDKAGLFAQGARFYSPRMGRWLTPDPAGFADGPNRYAYVGNQPLEFEDRSGLAREGNADSFALDMESAGLDLSGRPLIESNLPWVDLSFVDDYRRRLGPMQHMGMPGQWAIWGEAEAIVEGFINAPHRFDRGGQLVARATTQRSAYGVLEDLAAAAGEFGNGILGLTGVMDVLPVGAVGRVAREVGEDVTSRMARNADGATARHADSVVRAQADAWRALATDTIANHSVLRRHWDNALSRARSTPNLSSTRQARREFNRQRRRFWRQVRNDPEARLLLREAGLEFRGRPGSAPVWIDSGERLTIEHIERLSDNPSRALNSSNLTLSPQSENSNFFESMRAHWPWVFE